MDGSQIRMAPLAPEHAPAILAGQDSELAREIIGLPWSPERLAEFLDRVSHWSPDGPLRELAALDADGVLVGGGGIHRLGPGLERGQVDLTYWVLAAQRGRGIGHLIAARLVELARGDARTAEVVLRIAPENSASRAVARALGARPAGRLEHHPGDATRVVERWRLALR